AAAADEWVTDNSRDDDPRGGGLRLQGMGLPPENNLFQLLTHQAVQQELHLSGDQVQGILELAGKRRDLRTDLRKLSWEERIAHVQQLVNLETAWLDYLEPEQVQRLQQIAWQQRGPFAFTDPEVSDALRLTAEQNE